MCCQRTHGTGVGNAELCYLIPGPLTLREMGSAQDILRFFPLVPIWVALPALPTVGPLGKIRVIPRCGSLWGDFGTTPETFCSGIFPSSSTYGLLYLCHASLKEKDHILVLTASGHNLVAWRRRVRLPRVNSLILWSTIAFWWWEPTMQ